MYFFLQPLSRVHATSVQFSRTYMCTQDLYLQYCNVLCTHVYFNLNLRLSVSRILRHILSLFCDCTDTGAFGTSTVAHAFFCFVISVSLAKNSCVRKNTPGFTLNDKIKNVCATVDVPNAPVFVKCIRVQKSDKM